MILSGKTKEFKSTTKFVVFPPTHFNPILRTAWLDIHALTLKRNNAKYNFREKSSYLHTFLKVLVGSRKF
jgi:hypothetical protein